jgi:glycosyltransferase involved in cell wall biosynthesis
MKIAALIPAYNEEKTIAAVLREVRPFAAEIVVVDDGSTDGTAAAVRESGATVLRHEANRGKGAALRTGLDYLAGGGFDAVLSMDSDLQH